MNEIKETRLAALEEATRRMRESDYEKLPFASMDDLIRLLKLKQEYIFKIQPFFILDLIEDANEREDAKETNKQIEVNNKRIEDTYLKPLEVKIKVLELEFMLFNGIFESASSAMDIHEKVYPLQYK